jgi:hypothetical protein
MKRDEEETMEKESFKKTIQSYQTEPKSGESQLPSFFGDTFGSHVHECERVREINVSYKGLCIYYNSKS